MNCKICGRNLKNPKAIAKGMGAVCEKKHIAKKIEKDWKEIEEGKGKTYSEEEFKKKLLGGNL